MQVTGTAASLTVNLLSVQRVNIQSVEIHFHRSVTLQIKEDGEEE